MTPALRDLLRFFGITAPKRLRREQERRVRELGREMKAASRQVVGAFANQSTKGAVSR